MNKQELQKFIGSTGITLSEAMRIIDSNTNGIMFFTDESGRLIGCITDGDIRRFLLEGGKLDDQAVKAANMHPKVAYNQEEAGALYHGKNYVMIPILDSEGRISDLYNGNAGNSKIKQPLNVPVVINAGGRGTRLEPFTKVLPKPLIPIGDYPIIELIMKEYQSYDCDEFHIIVNYKKDLIKAYFQDNDNHYNITWYNENKPLGTGGGLSLLKNRFEDTFFFANCDVLLTANYGKMLQFHKENGNTITMICAYKNMTIPYGTVEIGKNGVIEEMKEKPVVSFLTNTGMYIVEPEVTNDIQEDVSISFPEIIEMEKRKGRKVAVFPISENDWMDMGQLSELEKMRSKLLGE